MYRNEYPTFFIMALSITKLHKTYPNGVKALDDINLETGTGIMGLLGPNGAGKSTLMRTIATLQAPDGGAIVFDGINVLQNPHELRKKLGYLPQDFGVYPKISAESLLDYFAILKGVVSKNERKSIVAEVLELTNLYDQRKKEVSGFSGGMKQRFGIAQLLLNKPKLIVVDEPTAGLDPAERSHFLNVIRAIGADQTVIFSTHIVEDIKDICQTVVVIQHGKVVLHEAPINAVGKLAGKIWITSIDHREFAHKAAQYHILSSTYNHDHTINIRVFNECKPASDFRPTPPRLEDAYFLVLSQNVCIDASNKDTHE